MSESLSLTATPGDAAEYLMRHGRPAAPSDQQARAAGYLLADPHYRDEIARDAKTLLTEGVDIAMSILARHDRQREREAAAPSRTDERSEEGPR